jgi:hypothetical protein
MQIGVLRECARHVSRAKYRYPITSHALPGIAQSFKQGIQMKKNYSGHRRLVGLRADAR